VGHPARGAPGALADHDEVDGEMAADYDDVVPTYFPKARPYSDAMAIVWPRIKSLIP
jgi:hypothetical protein